MPVHACNRPDAEPNYGGESLLDLFHGRPFNISKRVRDALVREGWIYLDMDEAPRLTKKAEELARDIEAEIAAGVGA